MIRIPSLTTEGKSLQVMDSLLSECGVNLYIIPEDGWARELGTITVSRAELIKAVWPEGEVELARYKKALEILAKHDILCPYAPKDDSEWDCGKPAGACSKCSEDWALLEAQVESAPCPDPDDKKGICGSKGDCNQCVRDYLFQGAK